jgi:serine/threonine protein kinase
LTLAAGTRLGPYEILAPIGAGGMGEVYKARDTRLERTVAVKVLPQHLSSSPEVRLRFEREAKTISQLSHPHICALYDVGREGEHEYLVMELLEGETLSDRLAKGPLPLDQTLRFGVEIADALDKAHRQGIVHRDLKPANVMITKSGVKLLDFGLAKAMTPAAPAGSLTALPTQEGLTQEGTILGTIQYMAPEQLEAKVVDARTDIFAFGATLYEMATGKKAFSGASQASLISAIMTADPAPISSVQPMSPPALDRVVKTCLAKDPEDRWQNAGDVAKELKWIAEGAPQAGLPSPNLARARVAWSAFAVAALAALLGGFLLLRQRREPARMFQSSILPPPNTQFSPPSPMAVSPDGRRIAFVAQPPEGASLLWVRPFDAPSAQPLAGTEGAYFPFWSPDSRFLGFFAAGKLKKIEASGGPAQTLCDAPFGYGGTWNRNGVILFVPSDGDSIRRVADSGGAASPVTRVDDSKGETSHNWPLFLPDGRHFLYLGFLGRASPGQRELFGVYLGSLDSKDRRLLMHAQANVAYAPSAAWSSQGHLLFLQDRTLLARPFDAEHLQFTGESFPVAEQVNFFGAVDSAIFSVSENGILAYQPSAGGELSRLLWFDRGGKQLESVGDAADYDHPRLSHDGRRVAVVVSDPQTANADIWIYDLSRRVSTRFTLVPAVNLAPIWSPDDSRIVFASNRKGVHDLYQKAASGAGNDELLLSSAVASIPLDWSREGGLIAFRSVDMKPKTGSDIGVFSVADRKMTPFLSTPFNEGLSQFSADGRWMAYVSDESGRKEVYVQAFPASSGKWQISSGGGSQPRWRRDEKEIFYIAPDKKLMAVEIKAGSGFEVGVPRVLFNTQIKVTDPFFEYDVSADGERFLVNTVAAEERSKPITVVQNWTAGLKK